MRDWHEHHPSEGCDETCPEPHMNDEEAADWYKRLTEATRIETHAKIMNEGGKLPTFIKRL